jgi:hypothetical protein
VLTLSEGVQSLIALLDQLVAAGRIGTSATGIRSQLVLVAGNLQLGNSTAGLVVLQVVKVELEKLVAKGEIAAADAAPLQSLLDRILGSSQTQFLMMKSGFPRKPRG